MKKQLFNQLLLTLTVFFGITIQTLAQPSGYEPPTTISDADAYRCANYFKEVYGDHGIPVSGGVITREAFDMILKTTKCNAITYKFCMDPTGRIASPSTIFLVVSGADATFVNGELKVNEISAPRYNSNDWCPPSCMKFMIVDPNTGQTQPME